jgi:hypothetical protein
MFIKENYVLFQAGSDMWEEGYLLGSSWVEVESEKTTDDDDDTNEMTW